MASSDIVLKTVKGEYYTVYDISLRILILRTWIHNETKQLWWAHKYLVKLHLWGKCCVVLKIYFKMIIKMKKYICFCYPAGFDQSQYSLMILKIHHEIYFVRWRSRYWSFVIQQKHAEKYLWLIPFWISLLRKEMNKNMNKK